MIKQAEQHADRGHHHRGQHQEHVGEPVELRQQQREDQADRHAESLAEERRCLCALLVRTAELPAELLRQAERRQRFRHLLLEHRILCAFDQVCRDRNRTRSVEPGQRAEAARRFAGDEVRQRYRALRRFDPQLVQHRQRAPVLWQAQPDVDGIVGARRAVIRQLQAGGHQLHHGADGVRSDAVFGGFGAIDLEFPVD